MKKKILTLSLVAVAILILVSFTGVVGYQTTKSSTIATASPLFTVRSSRAIDEESKDFTCDYVGKGEENEVLFPLRDRELSFIYLAIKKLDKMDVEMIKSRFQQNNLLYLEKLIGNENLNELMDSLYQIRKNPKEIINNLNDWLDNPMIQPFTIYRPLYLLIILFFMLVIGLWIPFMSLYAGVTCDPCCYIPLPDTLGI